MAVTMLNTLDGPNLITFSKKVFRSNHENGLAAEPEIACCERSTLKFQFWALKSLKIRAQNETKVQKRPEISKMPIFWPKKIAARVLKLVKLDCVNFADLFIQGAFPRPIRAKLAGHVPFMKARSILV